MRVRILYHDHCFDGAASAAFFSRFHEEKFSPGAQFDFTGLAHKATQLFEDSYFDGDVNAIVDFKYSPDPRLTWWFDHHQSAILRTEEGALVMIEPPRQAGIGGVFEVHDGVDIAVEVTVLEKLRCLVSETCEVELRSGRKFLFMKTAEERCRSRPVEAVVMVQDSHPHWSGSIRVENLSACLIWGVECNLPYRSVGETHRTIR